MHSKFMRITSVTALLLWMLLIFLLSSETAAESSATSGGLSRWLFSTFFPKFNEMSAFRQQEIIESFSFIIRKSAHLSLYAILGVFASLSVLSNGRGNLLFEGILSFSISILYAATDEFHQLFVSGRSGEVRDFFIDSSGALIGVLFTFLIYKAFSKRTGERRMKKKELMQKYFELYEQMQEVLAENSRLTAQLDALYEDNQALKQSMSVKEIEDKAVNECEKAIECEEKAPPIMSDDALYAAECIGKIVVSATEYSNKLSHGGNESNRELINMILSKTESLKANILEIVLSEATLEDKKRMIDSCKNASEDYFESVMAQTNLI